MPQLIWWIVGAVFGLPLLIIIGLFVANRFSRGNPGKAINILWMILAIMLTVFLGMAIFTGAQ